MIGLGSRRMTVVVLSLILLVTCATAVARPARASGPDFALSASPSSVVMPEDFWGDTMLTVSSLNGFQGTVQISVLFVTNVAGLGAGINTGMSLNPGDQAHTDISLTAGTTPATYTYPITATN